MAKTVCYQLYSSAYSATSTSLAVADILRPGKIIAIAFAGTALGGAGIGHGTLQVQVNTNGSATGGTNNPQREAVIGSVSFSTPNAGGTAFGQVVPNIAIPVNNGDRLNLSGVVSGTAPASGVVYASVYVHED